MFTHGYVASCVNYIQSLARLASKYRLVLFDNCCRGLNTRLSDEDVPAELMRDPSAAEHWLIEFMTKTIDALPLPEKFLLAGHSFGGYLVSLYASQHPERVRSLFLCTPAFIEPYSDEIDAT